MTVEMENEEEGVGFFRRLFGRSRKEESENEQPHYRRKLFDGRIEKYLDQNLDSYISEYGIITGLDMEVYEERYSRLTGRIKEMSEYMAEADAQVSVLENEMGSLKKASNKKGKGK